MSLPVYSPFLILLIAIPVFIIGLILLFMGLNKGKTKLWLPGLIIMLLAITFGILGFISEESENEKIHEESSQQQEKNVKHNTYVFSDSATYSERPVDSTYAEPLSGIVEDAASKKVYIKVFPSRELKGCGLSTENVENGRKTKDFKQAIGIVMFVNRAFSGNLLMRAYDYEKQLLGKSTAKIKKQAGDKATVNFGFDNNTDFSKIDYCTLGFDE